MKGECCLVLQDVVIGRPSPLLRELQVWGSKVDPVELVRVSSDELAGQLGLDPDERQLICTEGLSGRAFHSAPPDRSHQ